MNDQPDLSKLTCTASEFGVLGAELLRKGTSVRFQAGGSSMHPLVRDGDTLLITPCQADRVRLGEIVLCSAEPDRVLVHRVIRRRAGVASALYFIQGDQSPTPDGWIDQERIHGCLEAVEREGRRISMNGAAARVMGLLLVMVHRLGLRQSKLAGLVSRLLKLTPFFAGYLN